MTTDWVVVAIDGPGASGKSTVARKVASELGFAYVDTGAMYRTLAWHCLARNTDLASPRAVGSICRRWRTSLHVTDDSPAEVYLAVEGYRPVEELRSPGVTKAASDVAVVTAVRRWMRDTQRTCVRFGNLVMEGRDIGTNVFPESNYKFWLDASAAERARRRGLQAAGDDLAYRDRQDSQRASAPLMPGLGARRIDTTARSIDEVVREIAGCVQEMRRQGS